MAPGRRQQRADHRQRDDQLGGYRPAVQLGGHRNSVFAHNVTKNIDVFVDAKSGEPAGQNNIARDNVLRQRRDERAGLEVHQLHDHAQPVHEQRPGERHEQRSSARRCSPAARRRRRGPAIALPPARPARARRATASTAASAPTAAPRCRRRRRRRRPTPTPAPAGRARRGDLDRSHRARRPARRSTLDGTASTGDGTLTCAWSFENAERRTSGRPSTAARSPRRSRSPTRSTCG